MIGEENGSLPNKSLINNSPQIELVLFQKCLKIKKKAAEILSKVNQLAIFTATEKTVKEALLFLKVIKIIKSNQNLLTLFLMHRLLV